MPEIEPTDHHRAIGKIHHGAWAIGGDELAVAHFADRMIAGAS